MRPRPEVVVVAHAIHFQGGMERAMAELVRRLATSFRLVVVAAELAPELRPLVWRWMRIPVPRRPAPLRFTLFYLVAGLQLARMRPDVVHTLGAIVPNRCDVASVHCCHAGLLEARGSWAPSDAPLLRRLNTGLMAMMSLGAERWSYRPSRVRRLAAVSPGLAREVEHHYPGIAVAVTPNGVDPHRYRPSAEARSLLRAEQGIADQDVVVLFVGGDWHHKGLGVAVEATALASGRTRTRLHLWVVGSGVAAHIPVPSGGPRPTFFGPRPDAERYFAAADILVLPSYYETFSLVAHEAAACGLPVVATRVSGVEDLIGSDDGGILVERTAGSVGDALSRLVDQPELRARMGHRGRQRAAAFTWERSTDAVRRVYESLLAG